MCIAPASETLQNVHEGMEPEVWRTGIPASVLASSLQKFPRTAKHTGELSLSALPSPSPDPMRGAVLGTEYCELLKGTWLFWPQPGHAAAVAVVAALALPPLLPLLHIWPEARMTTCSMPRTGVRAETEDKGNEQVQDWGLRVDWRAGHVLQGAVAPATI